MQSVNKRFERCSCVRAAVAVLGAGVCCPRVNQSISHPVQMHMTAEDVSSAAVRAQERLMCAEEDINERTERLRVWQAELNDAQAHITARTDTVQQQVKRTDCGLRRSPHLTCVCVRAVV